MAARLAVHVVGPLRPYRDGFAEAMRSEGYAEGPVELHSHLLAHLSRWLLGRGLGASDLTPPVLEEFFAGRRARRRWLGTTRAAQPLLRYLRAMGAVPEEVEQPPVTAADERAAAELPDRCEFAHRRPKRANRDLRPCRIWRSSTLIRRSRATRRRSDGAGSAAVLEQFCASGRGHQTKRQRCAARFRTTRLE
jgi:catechol 2,3-dioxygenase-like lactoylglutathione lyase family enzyme